MSNIKKELIAILCLLFGVVVPLNVIAQVGCCSNPGAGIFTCLENELSQRDSECCPQPQTKFPEYYKSQLNPFGPSNYNDCINNFFAKDQACLEITACDLGCCCSQLGGEITSQAQCMGTGLTFHSGAANCDEFCPTPECSDNINNDNNGCADFDGGDLGCDSPTDATESGGDCTTQILNCNNANYVPKLSNLVITPAKGQKKFSLAWQDECSETAAYYDILRCTGSTCTNFVPIGTTSTRLFDDASDSLLFGTIYNYKVVAHYNLQTATPSIIKTANLGDIGCFGKLSSDIFCSASTNIANYCDDANKLVPEGTVCSSSQVCVVDNNQPSCLIKSDCSPSADNPFGLFYTLESCENGRYCFYDKSYTTVNSCFSCATSMACYDYKTEEACNRNNCRIGNCEWKSLANQIGVGVCVSTDNYNCQWCKNRGTTTLGNLESFNDVFDFCTQEKSDLLSEGGFGCYFKNGTSKNCNEAVCADYNTDQCSNSQISHDENNEIVNPSEDDCGINVCQNINNICVKNADGDNKADCTNALCEKDYFAPNTIILPVVQRGITRSLLIQIYDKTSGSSPITLKTTPDYSTYFCVEPCSPNGHPYDNFTRSRSVIVSNLKVFDGTNGNKLLTLNEGQNVIRYYSQDPAKNIEGVKKILLSAHSNTDGPRVLSVNISGSSRILDKIYTNSQRPTIEVQFFEPATVTFLRLVNRRTNAMVTLQGSSSLNTRASLSVAQALPDGEYALELNAKNQNEISMAAPYTTTIFVDSLKPNLTIEPANNAILNKSLVIFRLEFGEEVDISSLSIKLNSEESKGNFTTANNKLFTATMNLSDGNKNMEVTASDLAKNQASGSVSFIVDAMPTTITLVKPRFGTLSSYVSDIIVETDNDVTCRFSTDQNFEFDFMEPFTTTGGTQHIIRAFNEIASGDLKTHKLYVRCSSQRRGIVLKLFDINVDLTPPQLISAFAVPNPVVERPSTTTLKVEADESVTCKFSDSATEFANMEGKFEGFDENNFKNIATKAITIEDEGNFLYHVVCKNKAELSSETEDIQITVDLSLPLEIISHTPELFNSTSVVLAIETNKVSQCKFSETDPTVKSGEIFGAAGHSHTRRIISSHGQHTFHVICKDQFLEEFSDVQTIEFTVDTTPPTMLFVDDTSTLTLYPEQTCNKDKLRIKWLGQDEESMVKEYIYSILKGSQTILNWTKDTWFSDPENQNEWQWIENLNLDDSTKYFFKVQSVNYVNLISQPKNSDGITVNVSRCNPDARCGDGQINQAGEECDGFTFGAISSCLQYTNFIGGTLRCTNGCKLDTSNCETLPTCGNRELDRGESCDGTIFGIIDSCSDFNNSFISGTLRCTTTCQLDTSSCTAAPTCGNKFIDRGESCDSTNLGPLSGNCVDYNPSTFTSGTLSCNGCQISTSGCQGVQGTCGNGILNIGEACDGTTFGAIDLCADYSALFTGGQLKCSPSCQLDTSNCTAAPTCGNKFIDRGESCDSTNLGPLSGNCVDYSVYFNTGKLSCDDGCRITTSSCTEAPTCGNDILNTGEICDGTSFGNITDLSCSSYSSNFVTGTLSCKSCRISTDSCSANIAIPCKDRGECKLNEPCTDSSDCESRFCLNGKCTAATCDDSIKNQGEPSIDCGGPCDKCQNGKACNLGNDCQSNFCGFGTCKDADICYDGRLTGGESDIDCGGACPEKCPEGKNCNTNEDCGEGLRCSPHTCKKCEDNDQDCDGTPDSGGIKDTDNDGMPDEWEIQNDLDPNDPNDADLDADNDGLTNSEEFKVQDKYNRSTDPNLADTDNDGFSDKEEIDKETNPLDPEDFPKFSLLKTILFVLGISALLSGFGYFTYRVIAKRNEEKLEALKRREAPKPIRAVLQQPIRQISLKQREDQARIREALKKKEELKEKEMKNIFTSFEGGKNKEPQTKAEEPKPKAAGEGKNTKEEPKQEKAQKIKKPKRREHKEDVFAKLKKISKEQKKEKS